jgi:putative transposase
MGESKSRIFIHVVWSTKYRHESIANAWRRRVHRAISASARNTSWTILAVDGTNDHVHVLVAVPPDVTVAAIVHRMKGYSARFVNARIAAGGNFRWQEGYGAFSISQSEVPAVVRYIRDQWRHHAVADGHMETESGATRLTEPEGFPRIQAHSAPTHRTPAKPSTGTPADAGGHSDG